MIKMYNLRYDGDLIGYRVVTSGRKYDVSCRLYDLLVHDFEINTQNEGVKDVNLIDQGKLWLVPGDNSDKPVKELTYAIYADLMDKHEYANTDMELKLLYNKYNKLCFNDELPKLVEVQWSNKMTRVAGRYMSKSSTMVQLGKSVVMTWSRKILLSKYYYKRFPDDIINVLVHEMIHAKLPHEFHSNNFKLEMERINSNFGLSVTRHSLGVSKCNFLYICSKCGKEFETLKEINLSRSYCGKCHGELELLERFD